MVTGKSSTQNIKIHKVDKIHQESVDEKKSEYSVQKIKIGKWPCGSCGKGVGSN